MQSKIEIGKCYWAIRTLPKDNAVCIVKVKVMDIEKSDTHNPVTGDRCLCVEYMDGKEPVSHWAVVFDPEEVITPFWTRELYLYDTIDEALRKLELAINDGVREMRDLFKAMREKGIEANTRNQLMMFPLNVIEVKHEH